MKVSLMALTMGVTFQALCLVIGIFSTTQQEQNFANFVGFFSSLLTIASLICVFEDTKNGRK
jgi:hypothetical protein